MAKKSFIEYLKDPDGDAYELAAGLQEAVGVSTGGFRFNFQSGAVSGDVAPGVIGFNNASQGAATMLYASNVDANGFDMSFIFGAWSVSGGTTKGQLSIRSPLRNADKRRVLDVTLISVGEDTTIFVVNSLGGMEPFADGDSLVIEFAMAGSVIAALGAVPGASLPSRAWAMAYYHPFTAPDTIRVDGYAGPGDGGGGLHVLFGTDEPAHPGKFSITIAVSGVVVWYVIADFLINIKALGADGSGATASTAAINDAIATAAWFGRAAYVPAGVFKTAGNHVVDFTWIWGDSINAIVECTNTDLSSFVFKVGGISHVSGFTVRYASSVVIAGAVEGELCAIILGTTISFCKSASIGKMAVQHVGTGVYDHDHATFSAHLYDIDVRDFSFAAVLLTSSYRTQNIIENIYAGGGAEGRNTSEYVFAFKGIGNEGDQLINLNAESTRSKSALHMEDYFGVEVIGFHAEDWVALTTGCDVVYHTRCCGTIQSPVVFYSVLKDDCAVFGIGDCARDDGGTAVGNFSANWMNIVDYQIMGMHSDEARTLPVTDGTGVHFIRRSNDAPFYLDIDGYTYDQYFPGNAPEEAWYAGMTSAAGAGGLIVTSKGGKLLPYGTTAARPTLRRADYLSRYFDTDKQAELIYHPTLGWSPPAGNVKRCQQMSASGTVSPGVEVLIVSATGGNVVVTLPLAPGSGLSTVLLVKRVDNSGNTVSFAAQAGNTQSIANLAGLAKKHVLTDGFTTWIE